MIAPGSPCCADCAPAARHLDRRGLLRATSPRSYAVGGRSQPNDEIAELDRSIEQLREDVRGYKVPEGDLQQVHNWAALTHELNGIRIRRVVLLILRRHHHERKAELLEDRPPLGRLGGKNDRRSRRRAHPRLRAFQISSAGHLRAHSAETQS